MPAEIMQFVNGSETNLYHSEELFDGELFLFENYSCEPIELILIGARKNCVVEMFLIPVFGPLPENRKDLEQIVADRMSRDREQYLASQLLPGEFFVMPYMNEDGYDKVLVVKNKGSEKSANCLN